ncbi:hypothetical protein, partial [Sedimenticola sp.]|uniref:hypothetical protein n=1 Tax=Sedimenticola sp. TaxID=1940285 RepID=UPI002FF87328|nr:hypothetical protein [Sedimenticola sp.]
MSSNQHLPLTDVRGIGPSVALRMKQYGILTANQLAGMSIAEFKLSCPSLEKKGEAFVKGARRLLKRAGGVAAPNNKTQTGYQVDSGPDVVESRPVVDDQVSRPDEARETKKTKKGKKSKSPVATLDGKESLEKKSKSDEKKKRKKKDKLIEQGKKEKKEKKEKKGAKKAKEGKKADQKKKLDKKDDSSDKKKKKEKKEKK